MIKKFLKWSIFAGVIGGVILSHQIIQQKFEASISTELRILAAPVAEIDQNAIFEMPYLTNWDIQMNQPVEL